MFRKINCLHFLKLLIDLKLKDWQKHQVPLRERVKVALIVMVRIKFYQSIVIFIRFYPIWYPICTSSSRILGSVRTEKSVIM